MPIPWPTVETMAKTISALISWANTDPPEIDEVEVRLQVCPEYWNLHTGDHSCDYGHTGFWGAITLQLPASDAEIRTAAEGLLAQAQEHFAQCEDDF